MSDVPDFFGDVRWLDEKIIRLVREPRAGPWQIDYCVNHQEGYVHTPRPHLASDGFGQNALSRLARRETGKKSLSAVGGGVAGYH